MHVGIFDPSCELASQGYAFIQWVTGGEEGIGLCGEHIQELYTVQCAFDQILNPQIALPPQTKQEGRGPQTDKHLPPSTSGQFLRKADI